ncbi:MAG: DUF401 family protein, partial [Archaeoglobaceae archaeon]
MNSLPLFASILIALLLSRKIGIGFSLLIASLFLGISTLGLNFDLIRCYFQLQSLEIMALVFFTYSLANLMDKLGMLEKISEWLNDCFGSVSVALIPLVIGLIPMPAGALVSASMLLPIIRNAKISAERLTVINYWFRHVWTPVWPLYPSVIIALAVLAVEYGFYLHSTLPIAILSFIAGLFLLQKLSFSFKPKELEKVLLNLYPIIVLISLFLVTKMLLPSILVSIAIVLLHKKPKFELLKQTLKKSLDLRVFALVFAVMGYKEIIRISNSAQLLYSDLSFLPVQITAFAVSFLVGFATGIEMSYSSISLPIFHDFAEEQKNLLLLITAGFF